MFTINSLKSVQKLWMLKFMCWQKNLTQIGTAVEMRLVEKTKKKTPPREPLILKKPKIYQLRLNWSPIELA